MTRATVVPHRRLDWLTEELSTWQRDGLVSPEAAEQIRARYSASRRVPFTQVVLGLGGAFVAVGVIWLIAANLDRIPPPARLAAVVALWLGLVAAAEALARRSEAETAADPSGRRGPFLACSGYPKCRETKPIREAGPAPPPKEVGRECPECGKPLVVRRGRRGKFIGCSGYPACRYTEDVKEQPPDAQ